MPSPVLASHGVPLGGTVYIFSLSDVVACDFFYLAIQDCKTPPNFAKTLPSFPPDSEVIKSCLDSFCFFSSQFPGLCSGMLTADLWEVLRISGKG